MKWSKPDDDGFQHWGLDLEDQIKMNRLIQGSIEFDGFRQWYDTLSDNERVALTCSLFDYGREYFEPADWNRAVNLAGLSSDSPLVEKLLSLRHGDDWRAGYDTRGLFQWIKGLDANDRSSVFTLAVSVFGINEGGRFESCKGHCDHWWHQDLKDPKVVEELRRNNKRR